METAANTVVITGAFSYTGKYATRLLLGRGYRMRTLTFHPERQAMFDGQVGVFAYNFDNHDEMVESLRGASTLINTYWVRFPRGNATFEGAVRNTGALIDAAERAGVKRIVHVSIANASRESRLGYYRGKAEVERMIRDSGLSYAILRPTVIFGADDILINNIAWFVRSFPLFGAPGDGRYRIRPIYVEDMASLLVDAAGKSANETTDAVGPETFTFEELVKEIARAVGKSVKLVYVPATVAHIATRLVGAFVGDVILTREEYVGLMDGLLAPEGPSSGKTRLTEWLAENGQTIGRRYSSEVARHYGQRAGRGQN